MSSPKRQPAENLCLSDRAKGETVLSEKNGGAGLVFNGDGFYLTVMSIKAENLEKHKTAKAPTKTRPQALRQILLPLRAANQKILRQPRRLIQPPAHHLRHSIDIYFILYFSKIYKYAFNYYRPLFTTSAKPSSTFSAQTKMDATKPSRFPSQSYTDSCCCPAAKSCCGSKTEAKEVKPKKRQKVKKSQRNSERN